MLRAYEFRRSREGPFPAGDPYLVLEHFVGEPVHRAVRPGHVAAGDLCRIAGRLLRALAHIHDRGLVHRDVKPGNVLVRTSPRGRTVLKLTDFGLSARAGRRGVPGRISGSLPYVAPETIVGGTVDGRTDLYAAGVLLFYLACGRLPFEGGGVEDALRWHLEGDPADPGAVRAGVPSKLRRLCRRLTARRSDDRPAGARDALGMIEPRSRSEARHDLAGPREDDSFRALLDRARVAGPVVARPPGGDASAWRRRLRTAAHLLDVSWYEVGSDRDPVRALGCVVLEMLIPVWDRVRAGEGGREPWVRAAMARGVAALSVEQSLREPLVLLVRPGAMRSALIRDTVRALERQLRREPRARFLLVAPCRGQDPAPDATSGCATAGRLEPVKRCSVANSSSRSIGLDT